jgi:anti-sigma regulatory factor (Ser/Thr protein kinase)
MDAQAMQREACVLPRSTTAPAMARGFVSSTLNSWEVRECFADLPLLASELVSNAVRHASGEVSLSLHRKDDCVRVAVHDGSVALPVMRDLATAHNGGWGMHIVERLASSWGLESDSDGKTVWCEVIDPVLQAPASSPTPRSTTEKRASG